MRRAVKNAKSSAVKNSSKIGVAQTKEVIGVR